MRARDSGCVALREECRGGGGSYGGGPGRVTLAVGHPGTPVPTQPRAAGGPRSPGPGARAPPVVLRAPAWGAQGASWRGGGVGRSGRRGEGSWRGGAARGARARGGSGGATFPGDPGRGFRTGGTTRRAPSPRLASGESPGTGGVSVGTLATRQLALGLGRATSTATFRAPAWAGLCMGGSMHRAPSMAVASGESPALGPHRGPPGTTYIYIRAQYIHPLSCGGECH